MSRLLKSLEPLSQYKDRKFDGSLEEYVACLRRSTTVYVGNLAFHTTEEQIHELFSKCGPLQRIVMGLDKNQTTPCGFCFVEYSCRRDTEECVKYLNGARLDERDVRIDFDWCVRAPRIPASRPCRARLLGCTWRTALKLGLLRRGFQEGRQFGRGKSGGQVRDEYRTDYDVGRGGYGKLVQTGLSELHGGAAAARPEGDDGARVFKRGREEQHGADDARAHHAEKNPRFRERDEDE